MSTCNTPFVIKHVSNNDYVNLRVSIRSEPYNYVVGKIDIQSRLRSVGSFGLLLLIDTIESVGWRAKYTIYNYKLHIMSR